MGRESRISATRPVFPNYVLPSIEFLSRRRRSESSSFSSDGSLASSISPGTSPVAFSPCPRLSRLGPDTLRCTACSTDLAFATQIVSKGFTGRHGRALLVAPPPTSGDGAEQSLLNVRVGRSENRQLVTGWHVVADITCGTCCKKLGWKYVDAKEKSQKYKVGKYILESERVTSYRTWGDDPSGDDGSQQQCMAEFMQADSITEVMFDSADEDECEDIFAGVWDAQTVAKRRNQMVNCRSPDAQ